ncbi:GNAT family N-acetyltransferase [Brevibacterium salitolerans]|uniref:N-acetyltransferase domain-containing protein n=1 Tax=Brevibacterium salitolerans TaxID=1403566 RepID=A0ABN2X2F4_9MICO
MLDAGSLPMEDPRVRIRPLRVEDAAAFAEGAADGAVREFAHLPEPEYTEASAREMIVGAAADGLARGDLAVLAIADPATDAFAGSIVVFDVQGQSAEVGFWLHPAHRGRGLTGAALALAARFAAQSGLHELRARTAPANAASRRALASAGFEETGTETGVTPAGETAELVGLVLPVYSLPELPLRTERLSLRLHVPGDEDWLHRVYSGAETARFLLEDPWTREEAGVRVRDRLTRTGLHTASGGFALVIEHAGEPVGDLALWLTDRRRRIAEIGWVLDPAHSGHGYAAEAVSAVLRLAFGELDLHRVAAQMDARNTASARLAERVGMRREAHLRQDWWSKGEWTDTVVYGMLPGDLPPA